MENHSTARNYSQLPHSANLALTQFNIYEKKKNQDSGNRRSSCQEFRFDPLLWRCWAKRFLTSISAVFRQFSSFSFSIDLCCSSSLKMNSLCSAGSKRTWTLKFYTFIFLQARVTVESCYFMISGFIADLVFGPNPYPHPSKSKHPSVLLDNKECVGP